MKYALYLVSLIAISSTIYAFSIETDPKAILEKEDRKKFLNCLESLESYSGSLDSLRKEIDKCKNLEIRTIGTGNLAPTTSEPPSKGYTAKHTLVLSGSTDYRIYSDRKGAVWKNNNPSGITYPVSKKLATLWTENGIKFEKGTPRPKAEGGNYYLFSSIEEGLLAKLISVRERWKNATVEHFLAGWGTDYVTLSFDKSLKIYELTDEQFSELFIQQLKKESPGLVSQLVEDGILIVN